MSIELPRGCQPSKVCSTDKTRPYLTHGYLKKRKDGLWLCATDSYRAVAVKVEGDASEGWVPRPALKALEAGARRKLRPAVTQVSKTAWQIIDGEGAVTYELRGYEDKKFPDLEKIDLWKDRKNSNNGDPFGFNGALLGGIAEALGCRKTHRPMQLRVEGPLKAIQVVITGAEDTHRALLMPIRLS